MPEPRPTQSDAIIILSTAGGDEPATRIARHLVENKLAACVNVVPHVRSVYHWKGKMAQDEEALLIVKTRAALYERVRQAIKEIHTYEMPEVIAFDISRGDPDILAWIRESTQGP